MILNDRKANCGGLGLCSMYVIKWKIKCGVLKHNGNLKPNVIRCWMKNTMLLGCKFHNTVATYLEIVPGIGKMSLCYPEILKHLNV